MIFNLRTETDLPENWTPIEAVAIVKCLDENGDMCFSIRSTEGLTDWECFGLLEIAARKQAKDVVEMIEDD